MILDRKKNTKRNIFAGVLQRLIALLLPFISRTVMIYCMGIAYVGISSLFTAILSVLNIAELGIGSALVYSMYKPIAEGDKATVKALLNFYKRCYKIIGSVIFVLGMLLMPFVPHIIKSDFPTELNIYIVYFISLVGSVASYFVYAYKNSILLAFQRNDIVSIISTGFMVIQYLLQIIIILTVKSYYAFMLVVPAITIGINVCTAMIVKKMFPDYDEEGDIDKSTQTILFEKVKSLFFYKIGGVVSNSVDNIVISAFLGLATLAIYGNYYYIISSLFAFLSIYYNAMVAGIGNKMELETKDENYNLFETLFFAQGWLIGWMTICFLCLGQDFISIWVGKEYLLDKNLLLLLAIYFYSWKINDIAYTFKDAAGLWEYDRMRPLLASICNLALNILLVNYIGLYGVIISTIVCELTFSLMWGVKVVFDKYFNKSFTKYLCAWTKYLGINVLVAIVTYYICNIVEISNLWIEFLLKICICCIVPNLIYVCMYFKNEKLKQCFILVRSAL